MREWKPVVGYEGYYSVSNDGLVRSDRFRTSTSIGKILKPGHRYKYPRVELTIGSHKRKHFVHVLLAKAFIPNPSNKLEVNHIDGDPKNCTLENLEWVTRAENQRHARALGLFKGYTKTNKLTPMQVMALRIDKENGMSQTELAKKYGINQSNVSRICRYKRRQTLEVQ